MVILVMLLPSLLLLLMMMKNRGMKVARVNLLIPMDVVCRSARHVHFTILATCCTLRVKQSD